MTWLTDKMNSKHFKKNLILLFFAISALTWLGVSIYGHYYISTDNAYINANVVQIAPRISGKIIHLNVENNQYVKKGEVLFEMDPEPFQLNVNVAQAELTLSLAELDHATLSEKRVLALVQKKFLSPQEGDNAIANFKTATAKVDEVKARLAEAALDLAYTTVTASTSGWVTNMSLRTGDIVTINQPLFALISDDTFWVDANFKETELQAIQPQQIATIVADLYPHHPFHGVVQSISSGAGTVFSLLPPENATGNWVKVTQRVPVRILITDPNAQFPLRIGTSATVTIHLHQRVA